MAYNNFPNYQYLYQPMNPMGYQQQSQPQNQSNLIWVQGEAGAKSYMVAPNNTVQLWDSESQVIYLKSADSSGMPSMKIIDYTIRNEPQIKEQTSYATKDDIFSLNQQLEMLKKKVEGMTNESFIHTDDQSKWKSISE